MSSLTKNNVSKYFIHIVYELIKLNLIQSGADFMTQIGKPATSWPNVLKGRQSATIDMITQLVEKYDANPDYLFKGTGPYFQSEKKEELDVAFSKEIKEKSSSNPHILPITIDKKGNEQVVVVSEYALASYAEAFENPDFIADLPVESIPHDLRGRGTIRKFMVYGDSMEPTFIHGDYIYCSYVDIRSPKDLIANIRNEYVYAVNTVRGLFLKRVYYHYGDDFLQLYSDKYKSTKDRKYQAFPMPLEEVRELWYFRRRYTAQAPQPNSDHEEIIQLKRDLFQTQQNVSEVQKKLEDSLKQIVGGK